jgi:hypothetical protein
VSTVITCLAMTYRLREVLSARNGRSVPEKQ